MHAAHSSDALAVELIARARKRRAGLDGAGTADPWDVQSKTRRYAHFTSRRAGRWVVVTVTGTLDAASAPALKRQLDRAVRTSLFLTLDLTEAEVTDEAVADLLSGMDTLLQVFGGEFRTIEPA